MTSSARSGAVRSRNASGLLSEENADFTAENTHLACAAAGLDAAHTVPWNLVPWPTGGRSLDHLAEATPWLGSCSTCSRSCGSSWCSAMTPGTVAAGAVGVR